MESSSSNMEENGMSTNGDNDFSEVADSLTECLVCQKTITEAKWLPCVHTFCSKCIGANPQGPTVSCPVCDKLYPSSELQADDFVQELVNERVSPSRSGKTICEVCAEDDNESRPESWESGFEAKPGSLATMHCLDCRLNVCDDCCKGHRRHCRSHVIVDVDDPQLKRKSVARFGQRCRQHSDERLKMFCWDCRTVVCVVCYADRHSEHKAKDVGHAVVELQRHLKEDRDWLSICSSGISSALGELETQWHSFEDSVTEARTRIRDKGEALKAAIDNHVTKLTKDLESLAQVKFGQFRSAKKEFCDLVRDAEHLRKYSLVLTESGNQCHVAESFQRLQSKAADLKVRRPLLSETAFQRPEVVFSQPDPMEFIRGETAEVFGKVTLTEDGETDRVTDSDNERDSFSQLLSTVNTEGRVVTGVTMLNNKMYIACAYTNTIFVHFADPPFSRSFMVLVKDMRCPNDIASCTDSVCIYISDSDNNCIWRIGSTGQPERWLGKIGQPWTISVNCGRVIIPLDGKPPHLNVYGPGAGILNRVKLSSAITAIQHAVELQSGHFVVSHGRNSDHNSRICELTKTGAIIRVFDGAIKPEPDPNGVRRSLPLVRWPKHIAVNGDRILVAEFSNHYVILLNSSFEVERILLSWDQDRIDAPSRLCYVPGTQCLLLAEASSVKVYRIQGFASNETKRELSDRFQLFESYKK